MLKFFGIEPNTICKLMKYMLAASLLESLNFLFGFSLISRMIKQKMMQVWWMRFIASFLFFCFLCVDKFTGNGKWLTITNEQHLIIFYGVYFSFVYVTVLLIALHSQNSIK